MQTFIKKQPVNYQAPYKNVLADIDKAIRSYTAKEGCPPNYILISSADYEHVQAAFRASKVIPQSSELSFIQSARVMRSPDMEPGRFDVVRN